MRTLALLTASILTGPLSAQDVEFPAGVDAVSVPMLRHCSGADWGLPLVEVVVEGKRELFAVDTGDSSVTLDTTLATELGLRKIGVAKALGVGGSMTTTVYRGEKLEVGGVVLWECQYTGGDVSFLGSYRGRPVRGGLGLPFLHEVVATLDYPAGRLELRRPGAFAPPDDALVLDLTWSTASLACKGDLGDGKIRNFGIDTGMESVVQLYAPMIRRLGIETGSEVGRPRIGFVGYGEEMQWLELASLSRLQLGDHVFRDLPVALTVEAEGFSLGVNRVDAGVLGSSMLAPFRVTFDIPAEKLYLEGDRSGPRWPITSGVSMERHGDAVWLSPMIGDLEVCEPDLAESEELLSIDGRAPPETEAELFDLLVGRPEVRLTVRRDGQPVELVYRRPWPLPSVGPGATEEEAKR